MLVSCLPYLKRNPANTPTRPPRAIALLSENPKQQRQKKSWGGLRWGGGAERVFEWQVARSPVIALTSRGYRRDVDPTRLSFGKAGLKTAAYCELDRDSAVFFGA